MALSSDQEALLDKHGTVINAFAWFEKPSLVFEAPIDDWVVRAKGFVTLIPGTPTFGSTDDIRAEMTLSITTSTGAHGGRQRVRGVTEAGHVDIGRSGAGSADGRLNVRNGGTLQVWREFRPFVRASHISLSDLAIRKDELLYPGDNEAQPPVANAGPDRLVITDEATATISLNASRSFAVRDGATIASYAWAVRDGTVLTGDTDEVSLTVSFPRGSRWIRLRVTDSNGVTHTTHRLVVVASPTECTPVRIDSIGMTPQGNTASVTVDASRLPEGLPTGAKVLISEIENYGTTDLIGYRERFSGWCGEESAALDDARRGSKLISLTLTDASAFLKANYLFPQSQNIAEDAGGWYTLKDANIDRFMHAILMWHTNILSLCDFEWSGEGETYPFSALTTSGGSFWENVDNLAKAFGHKFVCNSQSQLQVRGNPHVLPTEEQQTEYSLPTKRPNGIITTLSEDRYTTMSLEGRVNPSSYWLQASAIIAAESVNQVVSVISPSNVPNTGLGGATRNDVLVTSLAELKVWMGNEYAASYGNTVGMLTVRTINPSHFIEPADCKFVAVELPQRYADRYDLPHDSNNRWTVESIDYTYGEEGKRATLRLRKEVVAPEPARNTEQTDDESDVQVWDDFDGYEISPVTGGGTIGIGQSAMSLTQAQFEESLRRAWLKVYVGGANIDDEGNVDPDGDGDGGGEDDETGLTPGELASSKRNGGYYYVALRLSQFLTNVKATYDIVDSLGNGKALLIQYIMSSIIETDSTLVSDWVDQIFDVDADVPLLTVAEREDSTEYMYCANSARAGLIQWVVTLDPSEWDMYNIALNAISDAQLAEWYAEGYSILLDEYQGFFCYIYPEWTVVYTETQLEASTELQHTAMNLTGRPDGSFWRVRVSGKYETSTEIIDAFWRLNKSTGVLTASRIDFGVTHTQPPFLPVRQQIAPPIYPDYNASGIYTVTGATPYQSGSFPPRFYIDENRTGMTTGTGSFTFTFTDLGAR